MLDWNSDVVSGGRYRVGIESMWLAADGVWLCLAPCAGYNSLTPIFLIVSGTGAAVICVHCPAVLPAGTSTQLEKVD